MAQGIDSEYDCTQYAHQIAEKYTFVGRYYRMPPPYSHYPTAHAIRGTGSKRGRIIARVDLGIYLLAGPH
jgi:hypothetical protein